MIYEFNKKIINLGGIKDFYNKNKLVSYILPNGKIFYCEKHNVEDVCVILKLYLHLLKKNYADKDEYLDSETNNELIKVLVYYLKTIDYEKVLALDRFLTENPIVLSDLVVQLLGCHLVTRLDKRILTSEIDLEVFYNYLLNGFNIDIVDKIVYDEEKKEYIFLHQKDNNYYLKDEIQKIRNDIGDNEIELFYKK